jgi:hypothetical protein
MLGWEAARMSTFSREKVDGAELPSFLATLSEGYVSINHCMNKCAEWVLLLQEDGPILGWEGAIMSVFSREQADWEASGYGPLLATPSVGVCCLHAADARPAGHACMLACILIVRKLRRCTAV